MNFKVNKLAGRSDMHLLRKIWHIVFGSICLFIYKSMDVEITFWGYFATCFAIAGFGMDLLRLNNKKINDLVLKFMGPVMRDSEEKSFSGLPFYALGVGLSILFFKEEIAVLSIMFLVFADPIASFVGVNYGKGQILPNKSLQGATASFVTCVFITIFYFYQVEISDLNLIIFSVSAGIIGSLSELASAFNIDDNLTIPVLSGAGLTLVNGMIGIF